MKFYPSADNFTKALLVMLVTNITSDDDVDDYAGPRHSSYPFESASEIHTSPQFIETQLVF